METNYYVFDYNEYELTPFNLLHFISSTTLLPLPLNFQCSDVSLKYFWLHFNLPRVYPRDIHLINDLICTLCVNPLYYRDYPTCGYILM